MSKIPQSTVEAIQAIKKLELQLQQTQELNVKLSIRITDLETQRLDNLIYR